MEVELKGGAKMGAFEVSLRRGAGCGGGCVCGKGGGRSFSRRYPAARRRASSRPGWAIPLLRPSGPQDRLGPERRRSPDMRRCWESGVKQSIDGSSLSVCLSVCLSFCLCLPACLPVCLSACPSVCLPAFLSVFACLPACLYVCLSACLSICLYAFICVCLCRGVCSANPVCVARSL